MTKFKLLMNIARISEKAAPEDFLFELVNFVHELLSDKDKEISQLEEYVCFLEEQVCEEDEEGFECTDLDRDLMDAIFHEAVLRAKTREEENKPEVDDFRTFLKGIFAE